MAWADSEVDTTCASLLRQLQHIWDEVGEDDAERDKLLLQLEQECLEVYRRKVEQANLTRASLHKALADSETELLSLIAALGDPSLPGKLEKRVGTLKEQLAAVQPELEELRHKKEERVKQFAETKAQIQKISSEISGCLQPFDTVHHQIVSEHDLSLRRLHDYHQQLQFLQEEKKERLHRVLDYVNIVHELCAVLGLDFFKTITEVHSSLDESTSSQTKSISNDTLERLSKTLQSLQQERRRRIQKLQHLGASLIELWNLMNTPVEEQELFNHITCILGVSADDVTASGALSHDNIERAEVEVGRLDQLKASKMKELVLEKQQELVEIYTNAHMEPDHNATQEKIMAIIDSGIFEPSELLTSMDQQIMKAKEEALSRKDIMEKLERWMAACEEESWLDDYNRDENRYNASRGAHINLKRAERARATVNKIPALVDNLMAKTKAWEEERGTSFLYDGMRLLAMLDEYNCLRQEREEEKRRLRDQKRLQEHLMTEQEVIFGSRPSPIKPPSAKKGLSVRANGNTGPGTPGNRRLPVAKKEKSRLPAPINYVALGKEDSISISGSEPTSMVA